MSAARATPSWTQQNHQYSDIFGQHGPHTYIEDDSTDGGTGLGIREFLVFTEIGFKSFVSKAVIVVEAAKRKGVNVVQFHFDLML